MSHCTITAHEQTQYKVWYIQIVCDFLAYEVSFFTTYLNTEDKKLSYTEKMIQSSYTEWVKNLFSSPIRSTRRAIVVTPVVRVRVPVTLRQSFICKFFKSSYLNSHSSEAFIFGAAFIPWLLTPGLMPRGGAGGQKLEHL